MPFVIDVDPVAFTLLGIPVRWYGLIFVGAAAIGALVIFARRRRLPFLLAADAAAPAAALGQAIGHLGCLIGGDSYGTVTSLPWAVIYRNPAAMAPLEGPLHPTQGS